MTKNLRAAGALGVCVALLACGSEAGGGDATPDASTDDASAVRDDARTASDGSGPSGDGGSVHDATSPPDAPTDAADDGAVAYGDRAPVFDGTSGYVEIPDDDVFSQPTSGALTVEAWIRPDSLAMPETEGGGYVHFMGKGVGGQHEWVSRMYQEGNSEGRANRISFYAFNLEGGLGAGSYFQDDLTAGDWIHYVGAMDGARTYIYRDGVQRDSDPLSGYDITPRNGTAPVRIGTRDTNSFFRGSIARVAIYDARLGEERVSAHLDAMASGNYDEVVLGEPSLVAYYRLDETSGAIAHDAVGGRDGTYVGGVAVGGTEWLGPP